MHPRLLTLVLVLYPRHLRERYGAEIAGLLGTSPRPWRDLADVTRSALGERLSHRRTTMTAAHARTTALRLAWLLAVPAVLTVALVSMMAVTSLAPAAAATAPQSA